MGYLSFSFYFFCGLGAWFVPPLTPPAPLSPRRAKEGGLILRLDAGYGITAVRLPLLSAFEEFRGGVPSVGVHELLSRA